MAGGLPSGGKGQSEQPRHPPRHPGIEFAPRAHLRLFAILKAPPQLDASEPLRPLDPLPDRALLRVPRNEPRLLVGEAPLLHGLPERRQLVQLLLERRALLDRPHRHPQPLRAVVLE